MVVVRNLGNKSQALFSDDYAQWRPITSLPYIYEITAAGNAFIALGVLPPSERVSIFVTTDDGISWTKAFEPPPDCGMSSFASDSPSVYLRCTPGAEIVASHDNGTTWNVLPLPALNQLPPKKTGAATYMVASKGRLLISRPIAFYGGYPGVSSEIDVLMLSIDGGQSWSAVGPAGYAIEDLQGRESRFCAEGRSDAPNDKAHMFMSNDAGMNWSEISLPAPNGRIFLTSSNGLGFVNRRITGFGSEELVPSIFESIDGGHSWQRTGINGELFSVSPLVFTDKAGLFSLDVSE
jgi:photosystem II stability/assembly factor-like uncharacterized protein